MGIWNKTLNINFDVHVRKKEDMNLKNMTSAFTL